MPEPHQADSSTELHLADAVEHYQRQVEEGLDPDPESYRADHPELAAELAECFEGLGALLELRASLRPAADAPPAPQILGDFELVREIGRGGMGVVYEARQIILPRTVALKRLLSGRDSPADRQRFRIEAEAAARLEHPGIVRIFEVNEHDGQPYFTMEYVAGPSLAERLAQGPLPVREAAEVVRQVAEAVEHAHRRGVLHRDLKPSNVLLSVRSDRLQPVLSEDDPQRTWTPPKPAEAGPVRSDRLQPVLDKDDRQATGNSPKPAEAGHYKPAPEGASYHPRLTDFGLAKHLGAASGITLSGAVMGTPSYMAPEQAAGKTGAVGPAADVYALGAILYETLTGRPPFRGANVTETLHQVQFQDPVPPAKLNYRVPFELSTICLKSLHKEPERRYASAGDLADDLQAFLEGRPIKARPDTLLYRVYRAVRQEPYPEVMQRRRPTEIHKAWLSLLICALVTGLRLLNVPPVWIYGFLVSGGIALVFWEAPGRDDTLVERQVTSVWQAFLLGCLVTVLLDVLMRPPRSFYFSPVIAVLAGVANYLVADLLSGWFYFGALACFAAAVGMIYAGQYDFLILGVIFFITLMVPSVKYRDREGRTA